MIKRVEWYSDRVRLVSLWEGDHFPTTRERVEQVVVHSGGATCRGAEAVAQAHEAGRYRGLPASPYTFVVPTLPDVVEGRIEVYRLWSDEVCAPHTWGLANKYAVGILVCGAFAGPDLHGDTELDHLTKTALDDLVGYLRDRYNLPPGRDGVATSRDYDAGHPGYAITAWARALT